MAINNFPYTNFHELNLDWIIEKVKEAYSPDNPPENVVLSVNGATGDVILYPESSIRLPTVETNNWNIYRFANGVTIGIEFTASDAKLIRGTHRDTIYTSNNPPPYPVTSVNGQTGAVIIQFPVTSVNGRTGAVQTQEPFQDMSDEILYVDQDSAGDYWGFARNVSNGSASIYLDTANDNVNAYISFIPEDESQGETRTYKLLTTADIPSSSGVVSINAKTGVVTLYGTDIYRNANSSQTVDYALSVNETAIDRAQTSIAIVSNNNSHSAIQAGEFVYIKRTTGITEGLYRAINAIPANGAIASTDVQLVQNGGLNSLLSNFNLLSNSIDGISENLNGFICGWGGSFGGADEGTYTRTLTREDQGTYIIVSYQVNGSNSDRLGLYLMNYFCNASGSQNRPVIREIIAGSGIASLSVAPNQGETTATITLITSNTNCYVRLIKIR